LNTIIKARKNICKRKQIIVQKFEVTAKYFGQNFIFTKKNALKAPCILRKSGFEYFNWYYATFCIFDCSPYAETFAYPCPTV